MITSSQNPKLKLVRSLMGRSKGRRDANAFVVEGVRLIEEAVVAGWRFQFALFSDDLGERGKALVEVLTAHHIDVEAVSTDLLHHVSDTETPQGILAVLRLAELPCLRKAQDGTPDPPTFILIPDQIRDPGNLGTLLRTAAVTGVQAVFVPPETTDAFAPKVLRAGMGAHFRLPIHSTTWDEIRAQTQGLQVYLADMHGESCWETDLRVPLVLIVGGEADGASEEARQLTTQSIAIPMAGSVESLNAGVAGSVLMFELVRQRSHA